MEIEKPKIKREETHWTIWWRFIIGLDINTIYKGYELQGYELQELLETHCTIWWKFIINLDINTNCKGYKFQELLNNSKYDLRFDFLTKKEIEFEKKVKSIENLENEIKNLNNSCQKLKKEIDKEYPNTLTKKGLPKKSINARAKYNSLQTQYKNAIVNTKLKIENLENIKKEIRQNSIYRGTIYQFILLVKKNNKYLNGLPNEIFHIIIEYIFEENLEMKIYNNNNVKLNIPMNLEVCMQEIKNLKYLDKIDSKVQFDTDIDNYDFKFMENTLIQLNKQKRKLFYLGFSIIFDEMLINNKNILDIKMIKSISRLDKKFHYLVEQFFWSTLGKEYNQNINNFFVFKKAFLVRGNKYTFKVYPRTVSRMYDPFIKSIPENMNISLNYIKKLSYEQNIKYGSDKKWYIFPKSMFNDFKLGRRTLYLQYYDDENGRYNYAFTPDFDSLIYSENKIEITISNIGVPNGSILLESEKGTTTVKTGYTSGDSTIELNNKFIIRDEVCKKMMEEMKNQTFGFDVQASIDINGLITIFDASKQTSRKIIFRYPEILGWPKQLTIIKLFNARFPSDHLSQGYRVFHFCDDKDCSCDYMSGIYAHGIWERDPDYQIWLNLSTREIAINSLLYLECHFSFTIPNFQTKSNLKRKFDEILS